MANNFRDLKVWQVGKKLAPDIYRITATFPFDVRFGLTAQMRRAAVSVPSNMAEGFNRLHNKEYRHFLFISLGSCAELETQMDIAGDLGYAGKVATADVLELLDHESRMLRNLIKKL
jgi:four helix bundle protein